MLKSEIKRRRVVPGLALVSFELVLALHNELPGFN